jgi:hypothetical protein
MSQQQRQYLGLVTELLAKAGLQLGASEQELVSAWRISQGVCAILWLSASTLPSFALPVHRDESLQKKAGARVTMRLGW